MRQRRIVAIASLVLAIVLSGFPGPHAQQTCTARMEQDPGRNNLEHAPDYVTAPPGTLGGVLRGGHGPRGLVLIAGAGFGADVFQGFIDAHADRFTMIAVTLPGFGGSAAPPMPPAGTSYGERTWTRGAGQAVARLIEAEGLDRPIVLGHWLAGGQVALDLALERPDLVRAAILVSAVARFVPAAGSGIPEPGTPAQRAQMVDRYLAPQWFKTVTRVTWDDNNFLPRDYAIHPLRAQQLWRDAATPELPVWIRYLCEVWAHDSRQGLAALEVPVLLLQPRFDALYHEGPQVGDYMEPFLHASWDGVAALSDRITVETVADSRVFVMDDQPEQLSEAIERFLQGPGAQPRRAPPRPAAVTPAETAAPDYWGGRVERRGERHHLIDAGIALMLPDATWTLEAATAALPQVATLRPRDGGAAVTVQIQPVFGMSLEALSNSLEGGLSGAFPSYSRESLEPTTLGGRAAFRLAATWEQDGALQRSVIVFAKRDDDHMVSLSFRVAPDGYAERRRQFDLIAASLTFAE